MAAAAAPESYIGSVISLTSKSEIRYEGVLYTINTEESSIGLRNVRSFGTEGRKKDGQQIPSSDKIYEYILFRGSDIKDLQVKSSPPAQPAALHNDPAIIQSHYPRPASVPTSLPSAASTTAADPSSHNAPSGIQMPPPFQGNLPPYQPGASLPPWNSSPMPSSANGTGLTMPPMYWPGYYTPPSGFPHLQPPPFLRPPHGLTVPQALQPPLLYPGLNGPLPAGFPNMPEFPSFLQPGNNNNNLAQSSVLSASIPTSSSVTESLESQVLNKLSSASSAVVSVGLTTPSSVEPTVSLSQGTPAPVNIKPVTVPDSSLPSLSSEKPVSVPASMPTYLPPSQPPSANIAPVSVAKTVTPGPLLPTTSSLAVSSHALQTVSAVVASSKNASSMVPSSQATSSAASQATSSTVPSSQATSTIVPSSQATSSMLSPSGNASSSVVRKPLDVRSENKEAKQREWKAKQSAVAQSKKEPLLPAPKPVLQKVVNLVDLPLMFNTTIEAMFSTTIEAEEEEEVGEEEMRYVLRKDAVSGFPYQVQSHPITKFTEDFDFIAMNEKFNKDEVWGHLGKGNDDDANDYDEDNVLEDDETSPRNPEAKPVYVKDDFFDSLSCNTIHNGGRNGRIKFSEQRKIDTETFGDSARHRPMGMRGGRGPRGGPRGRGYYGRGYGYMGRGRGYSYPNHQ
ncbi:hypothetical protein EJB05_54378 [Eragrostis curvula]|uniref:DFDF domain-containing protein n=1 Tax=Eragrostis curvula TaxID=38414 RepID=A0A5J9SML8_9POAL|nr:hypothetical protein EJB05_54378 [Eragrostis curvula]